MATPQSASSVALPGRVREDVRGALRRLGEGWQLALWLLLTGRIALGLAAFVSARLEPPLVWSDRPYLLMHGGEPWTDVISVWQRWDARWYQQIAEYGYTPGDGSTHFPPLFPLLTRALSLIFGGLTVGGHLVWAELAVSSGAFFASMWLLYRVARLDVGPLAARLAVLLIASFPTGFFLLAPYTESLYLLCTLAAFWFAREGRPWAAGLAGLAAGLTRTVSVFLILPLAFLYLQRCRREGRRPGVALFAALLPAVGQAAFLLYLHLTIGEPLSPFGVEKQWGYHLVSPWQGVAASFRYVLATGNLVEALNLLCLCGSLALAVIALRRLPLAYGLYVLPYLALLFSGQLFVSPYASSSRYTLVLFPCFIMLALWLVRRPWVAAGWLVSGLLLQVTLLQYWVHWGWVA